MIYPKVTVTMTTSRRLNLFIKTINSFIHYCHDLDLIDDWICCDDRSSQADFDYMVRNYSFIKFIRSEIPGQAASLNLLFDQVKTEYCWHQEDDWEYLQGGEFIHKCFDVMNQDSQIKNVVLREWKGVYNKKGNVEYILHTYRPEADKNLAYLYDWSYPGFSLNPGLLHLPTIVSLGKNEERTDRLFDRPMALKYEQAGFKRANLMGTYITHIGEDNSAYDQVT
jgi:hypothetical protein